MKIKAEIDLDSINVEGYWDEQSVAALVKDEFDSAIRREIKAIVNSVVKSEVEKLKARIQEQMRILSPKKVDEYLIQLSREGR